MPGAALKPDTFTIWTTANSRYRTKRCYPISIVPHPEGTRDCVKDIKSSAKDYQPGYAVSDALSVYRGMV